MVSPYVYVVSTGEIPKELLTVKGEEMEVNLAYNNLTGWLGV